MNPWMDTVSGRFGDYVTSVVDNNVYFDFMTLFRRVVTNKVLMDPALLIGTYKAIETTTDLDREKYEQIVKKPLAKIDKVFAKLDKHVTVYQMRLSNFDVADMREQYYSPMLYFWIMAAAIAFGGTVDVNTMKRIFDDTFVSKYDTQEWGGQLSTQVRAKGDGVDVDLLQEVLIKIDERLAMIHYQLTEGRPPLDNQGNHHYTLQ